jgi:hypothetical protein
MKREREGVFATADQVSVAALVFLTPSNATPVHSAIPGRITQLTVIAANALNWKPGTTRESTKKAKGKVTKNMAAIASAGKAPAKYTRHRLASARRDKYAPAAPIKGKANSHGKYKITPLG